MARQSWFDKLSPEAQIQIKNDLMTMTYPEFFVKHPEIKVCRYSVSKVMEGANRLQDRKDKRVEKWCTKLGMTKEQLTEALKVNSASKLGITDRYESVVLRKTLGVDADLHMIHQDNQKVKADVDKIASLWASGATYKQMAMQLGYTTQSMMMRINRLRKREPLKFPLRPRGRAKVNVDSVPTVALT